MLLIQLYWGAIQKSIAKNGYSVEQGTAGVEICDWWKKKTTDFYMPIKGRTGDYCFSSFKDPVSS